MTAIIIAAAIVLIVAAYFGWLFWLAAHAGPDPEEADLTPEERTELAARMQIGWWG